MPSDSPRASKRRRSSSSTRTLQSSSHDSHSPKNQDKTRSRAERLAGFDDTDEIDQESNRREDELNGGENNLEDQEEELCAICLVPISNKTVVYPCHHGQFCWNCIRAWTDQSRKCPLCLGPIEHLIHNIRSAKDYSTHYLLPLHTITGSSSISTSNPLPPARNPRRPASTSTLPRHALYGRARLLQNQTDSPSWREREEEIALERRKYVYREGLYAKHVASNRYTGFKPFTPQTFANNPEMKAKVIKFIRRELQVFPAVDISFLTTYLISISSQLDLRSSAALRLIADFLSEQDAQHLVHEITTFARSPFKSLESYDKFIQYGRPEREEPKDDEMEKLVIDEESLVDIQPEGPRFAKNMYPDRRRRSSNTGQLPPQASMAPLPPKPSPEVRRRPPRSPSPPPLPSHRVPRRIPPGGGGGRRREPEPDWRERDARYTGSYYRSSESRRDSGRRNSGRGRERRESFRDDYRREFRERSRSRERSRERQRSRSRSRSVGRRRDDRYSRSPSPLPQDRRRRYSNRSPSFSPRRSPSPRPKHRSPSPFESKSRQSRSPTPTHSRRTATPPPPSTTELPQAMDPEYEDAISLSAPPLSEYNPSPRPSSPQPQGASTTTRNAPKISIFGAARRLLGNGNIVTFSKEGGVELQVAGSATRSRDNGGSQSQGVSEKGDRGKGKEVAQEKRILEEPYQPVPSPSKSTSSLLSRLGPASSSTQSPPIILSQPSDPTASDSLTSLKSKLQERLTAEYRQALSKLSSPSSTNPSNATPKLPTTKDGKMDLRAVLQARLQAEKARAYDAQVVRNASAHSIATSESTEPYASNLDGQGRTVFSNATKQLLLMRLEEERLLAQEQTSYHSIAALYTTVDPPTPSPPLPLAKPPSQPSSNEMDLKAKLLEKRKLAVEEELKKRSGELKEKLMREKLRKKMAKPPSTVGGGGTMETNAVAK